ncbi:MAG: serine/threonine-protein phosphatase [Candidatus Eremiobacteraeota bacterium]|nr:serine/threonine-protein phosphatase [Candidatus Eremiobacteraeota bacterium]
MHTAAREPELAARPLPDVLLLDALSSRLLSRDSFDSLRDALFDFLVPRFARGAKLMIPSPDETAVMQSRGVFEGPNTVVFLASADWNATLTLCDAEPDSNTELQEGLRRSAHALARASAFQREHRVAATFQEAALSITIPSSERYRIDAVYEPGRSEALVGGDWYDAFALRDGRLVLSIGDVVGSGIAAAITMVNVRQTIRGVAHVQSNPGVMLAAANMTLRTQYPDIFVTAFVIVIDPMTGYCTYAGAGHPPALIRECDGTIRELASQNLPLGVTDRNDAFASHRTTLESDATLLLYTDGIIEYDRDIATGMRRLAQSLAKVDVRQENIGRRIYAEIVPPHARDDIAMVALYLRKAGDIRRWRFDPMWPDAAQRVRSEIAAELRAHGFSAVDTTTFETIYSELISNALRYAPGTIDVFYEPNADNADNAILHVFDDGPGFEYLPHLPYDLFSERGRGLFLISQLAHDFSVEPNAPSGSHARLALRPCTKELLV